MALYSFRVEGSDGEGYRMAGEHPIAQTLRAQGRTQRWLAAQLGVSESLLSRYLHGHRPMPAHVVRRAAAGLGVPEPFLRSHGQDLPDGSDPFQLAVQDKAA